MKYLAYPSDFSEDLRKKPICGVLAIAMIGEITFARATEVIKNNMLSFQKRHGGKTYFEQRCNSLKELGIAFREIRVSGKPTLRDAIYRYCKPGKTYMIDTTGHTVTVKNDWVGCQTEISHIDENGSRRCFVRHIVEIL